ncbi:MAG TPA: tRNA pseudouridine synthase A, partial [Methylomirabilota bacterium]|nr:tRNA pseudouridine synthase A [Methylomirabilota bacterium]
RTVQGALLDALAPLGEGPVRVTGASRTDAGVHALAQVASVRLRSALAPASLQRALNARLPAAVRVLEAADAPAGFDARRRAAGKRYAYLVDDGAVPNPLLLRYAWQVRGPLDVGAMRAALRPLRGRHDFSAYCAAPGRDASPLCTVRAVHVVRRRQRVAVLVSADRFLHRMVRNIVGSAVAVGQGRQEPGWLAEILRSRERARAGRTAPARGLVLVRVLYPG